MDIELLIRKVFSKKQLWDQKDRQHHNRFVLDRTWNEIAREMKTTRDAARSKWKALRDTYRRELKKMPETWSGDDDSQFYTSWPHFESLSFLKDQFTKSPSSGNSMDSHSNTKPVNYENSNIYDSSNQSEEPYVDIKPCVQEIENVSNAAPEVTRNSKRKLENNDDITANLIYLNVIDSSNQSEEPDVVFPPCIQELKCPSNTVPEVTGNRRRERENNDDISATLIQLEETKIKMLEKQLKLQDEDISFFYSLLPHIRSLPVRDKLLLRIKMQELVYNSVCNANPLQQSTMDVEKSFPASVPPTASSSTSQTDESRSDY